MRREEADGNIAVSQTSCEIAKTLLAGECQDRGEVRYKGVLLCAPHASLLGMEDQAEAVLGSVFRMDEWMEENGNSSSDEEFVGRMRRERDDAVAALRLTRMRIRTARKALE